MATKTSAGRDFQDNLLGRIMEQNQIATIYLLNRMSLRGRIMRFDPYVIVLEPLDGGPPHMVYKSAVVSISGPRMIGGGPRRPGGPPHRGPGGFGPRKDFHGGSGEGHPSYGDRRPPYGERSEHGDRPAYGDRRPPFPEGGHPAEGPTGGFRPPRPPASE